MPQISAQVPRSHVLAVNDGIIATADVIEGFIAAALAATLTASVVWRLQVWRGGELRVHGARRRAEAAAFVTAGPFPPDP